MYKTKKKKKLFCCHWWSYYSYFEFLCSSSLRRRFVSSNWCITNIFFLSYQLNILLTIFLLSQHVYGTAKKMKTFFFLFLFLTDQLEQFENYKFSKKYKMYKYIKTAYDIIVYTKKNIKVTEWGNKSRFCSTLQSLTWRELKKIKTQRNIHRINFTLFNFFSFHSFRIHFIFSCMLKITLKCSVLYIVHQQKQRLANWYVLVSISCKYILCTCLMFYFMFHVLQNVSAKCFTLVYKVFTQKQTHP